MCAIAGIAGETNSDSEVLVAKMLTSMKHRGPDHSEVQKVGDHVFFGHNRLSIIDLHASANQPFVSDDNRYTIVFNGEIYNYIELKEQLRGFSFRTNSDTEVLLASYLKWGYHCLDRFIGMFSFAIWDNVENRMFAARDRFGVKPFYYSQTGNCFLFASEIKALWAAGVARVENQKVWSSFFVYGSYGMPNETFWQGIHQLPGGHFLILSQESFQISRWYDFEDRVRSIQPALKEASEAAITNQYIELLKDSIKLRFRADVPVGFNVSGGLDSSLLLSLIKKSFPSTDSIHAFSFYTGNPDYDELPWVKALIETTHYPLHAIRLQAKDVPAMAEEMAVLQDEPFGGLPTLAYATLFREARKQNIIVLLDGQGMDEAWAGYDYYQSNSGAVVQGVTGSPFRPDVLTNEFRSLAEKPRYDEPFTEKLLNLQYRDLFFTKIPRALRFNDRVSMQYSTELREPFLDHRLVEMAFALPSHWKIKGDTGKYLLRKIATKLLPENIRLAPKRALQTPQREWLAHELRDWADEKIKIFTSNESVQSEILKREWVDYLKKGSDNSFYIWQFINTALLARR
jgi:asparagine synthase (glutamine-hydrolysing)